jgi:thymidine phosphorylase
VTLDLFGSRVKVDKHSTEVGDKTTLVVPWWRALGVPVPKMAAGRSKIPGHD